ncbi:MAG: hypothetical protein CM1200mP41_28620 [Gammaproteobacteria bacterium]|nr:MAG: hypothetical protein CM1200mP41_28620 [Gammaproteobacteria bacterium]
MPGTDRHRIGDPRTPGPDPGTALGARSLIEKSNLATPLPAPWAQGAWLQQRDQHVATTCRLPLIKPDDINAFILAQATGQPSPGSFSRSSGSNPVLCTPPDLLPLQFGDDSFKPHLAASRALNIEPAVGLAPGACARY